MPSLMQRVIELRPDGSIGWLPSKSRSEIDNASFERQAVRTSPGVLARRSRQ
jgi:hypothetical protein